MIVLINGLLFQLLFVYTPWQETKYTYAGVNVDKKTRRDEKRESSWIICANEKKDLCAVI